MTVDHLKMLHTAGGKGKAVRCPAAQQRGCVRLGETAWKVSWVSSGIWGLSSQLRADLRRRWRRSFSQREVRAVRGGSDRWSLQRCQRCEANRLSAARKLSQSFLLSADICFPLNFLKVQNKN